MSAEIIAHLLDEMEEYYGAFDYSRCTVLGWYLNDRAADAEEKIALALPTGVTTMLRRAPLHLEWFVWPADRSRAGRSSRTRHSTGLRPQHQTARSTVPFLALVPD